MADFKALAKDTVIYGTSSIIGRFLNYLLVPLYTYKITAESGGYGVVTNMYAYTALLLVILTFGMETTFFRFANKEEEDPRKVFSTISIMVGAVAALFVGLIFTFIGPISEFMGYPDHPEYVWTMAVIVALDAFQAILFALLRYQKKAIKFAALKLLFIVLNISLNLLVFLLLPKITDFELHVKWVFYINLFCTAFVTLFFFKEIKGLGAGFDASLAKRLLGYSWPILILGIAGILNQAADKILYPLVDKSPDATVQLGIYGACVKIAMIMALITQTFRYAYEPFVFDRKASGATQEEKKETYSRGMRYFIIATLFAFLAVMAYMGLFRYIISKDYWEGLKVVPIVMAAEIMMGIYFTLSFWYKLIDKTFWGAVFSGISCILLIAVNVIFIPKYGYMACAWGGVAGYGSAMLMSYFVGQKYYPIDYKLKDILIYVLATAVLFTGMWLVGKVLPFWGAIACNTILLGIFVLLVIRMERINVPALITKLRSKLGR